MYSRPNDTRANAGLAAAAPRAGMVATPFAQAKAPSGKQDAPPAFEFREDIDLVSQAWKEYTVGLNGGPAVKDLEARYGSAWRGPKNSMTNLLYERRSHLYRLIEQLQRQCGMNADEAVRRLDAYKKKCNVSLGSFAHWIAEGDLTIDTLLKQA